jgi:poly-gamma-glutamate synthesis protein (capsule biosynthesis protein)
MKARNKILTLLFLLTAITVAVSLFLFPGLIRAPITEKWFNFVNFSQVENAKILLVGDIMFDRGIRYYAEKNGGNDFIFSKIHDRLISFDTVVGNLEGPITDNPSTSISTKPGEPDNYFFTFDPSWTKTLFDNNIRIVNLGNNHILNFGRDGLQSTKEYLDQAKVGYFGALDYPKSVSREIQGIKMTFVNYNEFAALDEVINKKSTLEEIQKAKGFSDIIIVYCHWGVEYADSPTEQQINLAHEFIDEGADLVAGSHPHVIQPLEIYKGKRIYYSLGNFIFDQYFSKETENGLGVVVSIEPNSKKLNFEELEFYLQPNGQTILVEKNK